MNRSLSRISAIKEFVRSRRELQPVVRLYRAGYSFIRKVPSFPNLVYERQRIKKLKGCHKDRRRCFLVGNGPSVQNQDLTKLRDEVVFVTNYFVLHNQYREIEPTYYCVSDPRLFLDGVNPHWGQLMRQKTQATIKCFPLIAKKAVERSRLFHSNSVYYLNSTAIPIWKVGRMSLDVSREVYRGDSVIIDFCFPLAFYMGFSEIYLVGCDMDYSLDKAEDCSQAYFYDVSSITAPRQSVEYHKREWHDNVITSYIIARKIFEKNGRKIYNAGHGGRLDVFERMNYDDLF